MEKYDKVIDFMTKSGHRLAMRAGKIKDIGITKTDLTEEDLRIERGLKEVIDSFSEKYSFFAEEENNVFNESDNVWVVDPISGTKTFIAGDAHYSIVVAHVVNKKVIFAAVYDPSVDEMFTAYRGKGAFLNGQRIRPESKSDRILLRVSSAWKEPTIIERIKSQLDMSKVDMNTYSMAVNYCSIACGRWSGIITTTKDSFPEFAGGLIIQESGGRFTNAKGESDISVEDRIFIGGNVTTYGILFSIINTL
jgi:myo-inositol-1(or 4)-monophosphatase